MNPPAALNLKNTRDASRTWKKFKQSWMIYETASGTVTKDPAVRLATFLHVAGEDAVEKYNGFTFNSEQKRSSLEAVIAKFDKDCQSTVNVLAERYQFYKCQQQKHETYDQFVTRLRSLSIECNFPNLDESLRDQFVMNINCDKTREKLINAAQSDASALTFDKIYTMAKTTELSSRLKVDTTQDSDNSSVFLKKNVFCFFFKNMFFFEKKNTVEEKQGSKCFFFKTTCFQEKYLQFVTVC